MSNELPEIELRKPESLNRELRRHWRQRSHERRAYLEHVAAVTKRAGWPEAPRGFRVLLEVDLVPHRSAPATNPGDDDNFRKLPLDGLVRARALIDDGPLFVRATFRVVEKRRDAPKGLCLVRRVGLEEWTEEERRLEAAAGERWKRARIRAPGAGVFRRMTTDDVVAWRAPSGRVEASLRQARRFGVRAQRYPDGRSILYFLDRSDVTRWSPKR